MTTLGIALLTSVWLFVSQPNSEFTALIDDVFVSSILEKDNLKGKKKVDSSFSSADSLTKKLAKIQSLGYLPGFAVAIVSSEGIHYQKGFGYSDKETEIPYTIHTLQNIGSTSKTVLGVALMQLVEEGKLNLNTPINDLLPFEIVNPHFPNDPITVEHLATHTATLRDPWEYEKTYVFDNPLPLTKSAYPKGFYKYVKLYNENMDVPLPDFIQSITHVEGQWYKKKNFLRKKPGTTYYYSNMGAAIGGYIVELISGKPYSVYTQEKILNPLGMSATGWFRESVDMSKFAKLYLSDDQEIDNYSLITYPDGGLITNVHDLSQYFSTMIKGYKKGNVALLKQSSFQEMMDAKFESEEKNYGIFWSINGKGEYGHSGGDPGIMTYMMFDPETGIGRIVFTNKSDEGGDGMNEVVYIWKTLEKYMQRIAEGE